MKSQRTRGATDLDTYMAASVTYSATASATDVWLIRGSATRLVRVQRVIFSGTQTTAGNVGTIQVNKHSVANTGGTSASVTAVAVDSSQIAASAVVLNYTANPTVDGTAKTIWQPRMLISAPATAMDGRIFDLDLTQYLNCRGIVLRGINEELAINLLATIPSGLASLQVSCVWTEETYS